MLNFKGDKPAFGNRTSISFIYYYLNCARQADSSAFMETNDNCFISMEVTAIICATKNIPSPSDELP
jgi:hypothetical protein